MRPPPTTASPGENKPCLHGMPYAVAPDVQQRVPWVTWLSSGYSRSTHLSLACLQAQTRITHDSYFHSVLGSLDVATAAYRPAFDVPAGCRGDAR